MQFIYAMAQCLKKTDKKREAADAPNWDDTE